MASSNGADLQDKHHEQALRNGSNESDTIKHDHNGDTTMSVAGPSVPTHLRNENKTRPKSATQDSAAVTAVAGFSTGEDYIAFAFSDEESTEDVPEIHPKNKGKDREKKTETMISDSPHSGKKRSADKMNDGGGYAANKKQRMDVSTKQTPWVYDVNWNSCRNLSEMMHKEVQAFVAYISPTFEEHEVRGMVIMAITRAIQSAWPDASVSPFGSYQTKLYLPLGDIDLVVLSRAMESYAKPRVLGDLGRLLRKANITNHVRVIGNAKVPIIKFVTTHGRFAVDISLNQTNGVKAGEMINRLLRELPALKSLVMTIKLFLSQRNMNEVYSGGVGSYTLVCMVVSFIQMHPKIRAAEIDPCQNLGVLVMEFFELYGHHFNYENTGISIREGGTYFNKLARGWFDPRYPHLLSIEDPTDTANDVSKNSFNITRVRKTLAGAHEVLTAAAFMRARVLTAKIQGEYTSLRDLSDKARDYDNQSILGSIVGVTQETLNHRRMIKQLYDQGTLHNMLGITPRSNFPTSSTSRAHSAKAVESAWGEADMDMGDSDESYRHSPEVEEESRYSNRRPRKRQKLIPLESNGNGPNQPIYVEESDDDDEAPFDTSREKHLASPGSGRRPRSHDHGKAEARRAYWTSKGMPD